MSQNPEDFGFHDDIRYKIIHFENDTLYRMI